VANSDGEKGLVPATYLEDAGGRPFGTTELSQQNSQRASGTYGTRTADLPIRSVFFSLLPDK